MNEEQRSKAIEVEQNARKRLVAAQESAGWFQFVFHMEDGKVVAGWDRHNFRCDAQEQILAYVSSELNRLANECQCCKAKREAEQKQIEPQPV